jgi:hypothetical protein
MLPLVCNDAVAILFMFDLSRKLTLTSVKEWFRQVRGFNKVGKNSRLTHFFCGLFQFLIAWNFRFDPLVWAALCFSLFSLIPVIIATSIMGHPHLSLFVPCPFIYSVCVFLSRPPFQFWSAPSTTFSPNCLLSSKRILQNWFVL